MTVLDTPDTVTRTLVVDIPDLTADTFFGGGCCVVSAEDVVRRELQSWPGVINVDIAPANGQAIVIATGDRPDPADLLGAVESIGFPATMVRQSPNSSGGAARDGTIHDLARRPPLRRLQTKILGGEEI